MAVAVKLPRMSDTMEEGTLVSWQVKVGETVKPGDVLAEVETDKATMDLENFEKGTVLHLNVEEGDTIPVETVIAVIGKEGESYEELLKEEPKKEEEAPEEEVPEAAKEVAPGPSQSTSSSPAPDLTVSSQSNGTDRVFASPLAKKMAEEKGIDISSVKGSGDNGRIIKRDIENYSPAASSSSAVPFGQEQYEEIKVTQMRKTIARRLAESKFTAPHFYLTMEIRMDQAVAARKQMNEYSEQKISMNDLIIKAAAVALRQHPMVNAAWMGDKIRQNKHVHIGVAVAVEDGLLVPVVKFADHKSLTQISSEVKVAAEKAKNKQLQPADWEGNTFTVSNLGMFGIDEFTAIINPPDSCILAIGGAKETVIVENGEMKPGHVMKVTLSCDHRVVDGVTGAKFLQTFKSLLEEPVRILV
ncbi:pyruvate dehydrogenase complex dihydrolipoamide acetyltransferase [bacterium]|nr:pyruvate dehydrogenase complex dihydrolipoamide acetyltransferase [bacterium]